MDFPKLVCPPEGRPYRHFHGHSVVIRTSNLADVAALARDVQASGNALFCISVHLDRPLAEADIPDDLADIPLAITAPSLGRYSDLSDAVPTLRKLNLRVYLSAGDVKNLNGLRILSSLGIAGTVTIPGLDVDWEALADLAAFALLGRVPHAPIEPFAFIASACGHAATVNWGRINFDDPDHFLHLDGQGRVALSERELVQGQFIADHVDRIGTLQDCEPIRARRHAWRQYFSDDHPCASCPGWRVCLGRYDGGAAAEAGCATFFEELVELASHSQAIPQTQARTPWQL